MTSQWPREPSRRKQHLPGSGLLRAVGEDKDWNLDLATWGYFLNLEEHSWGVGVGDAPTMLATAEDSKPAESVLKQVRPGQWMGKGASLSRDLGSSVVGCATLWLATDQHER